MSRSPEIFLSLTEVGAARACFISLVKTNFPNFHVNLCKERSAHYGAYPEATF